MKLIPKNLLSRRVSTKGLFLAVVIFLLTAVAGSSAARAQGPCDVLSSSGTPCAAAYSTVRLLSSNFTAALYQVTNTSTNQTLDISAGSGGYANSAAQDTFCKNATCKITKLYDQTGHGVTLTLATSNEKSNTYVPGGDAPSLATASPIVMNGHRVYGVYIAPGDGYRNDLNPGKVIPTGNAPEGVYMVANSLTEVFHNVSSACCFDFGNAEVDDDDDGAGTMDAISLMCDGTNCVPTVQADLEQGAFAQVTPKQAASQFVMAALSNTAVATGTLQTWWGDAAPSGLLTTNGPIALSSLKPQLSGGPYTSYAPMHQEGAVLLGMGGDNSIRAAGEFYEGVVTTGAPTPAVWQQVLTNLQGAGYQAPTSPVADGHVYTFKNEASGMLIGNNGSLNSGDPVVEEPATDTPANTRWTAHDQGSGYFTLTNAQSSSLCLDSPFGDAQPTFVWPPTSTNGSTDLWQQTCNGAQPQNWRFIAQADGTYVIENQSSTIGNGNQMVVDDYYGQAQAGQHLWLNTPNGLSPQDWTVTKIQ